MKLTYLLTLALILAPVAKAESNLPDLSQMQVVGRVMAFPTEKPVTWFLPAAFTSKLDCSPDSGSSMRACTIKVYNSLTQEETNQLNQLARSQGTQLGSFTPLDAHIVQNLDERFENLTPSISRASPFLLKTLAMMGPSRPYASMAVRLSTEDTADLESQYQASGIGEFVARIRFNGDQTYEYLALTDASHLKAYLKVAQTVGIPYSVLKTELNTVLKTAGLKTKNLTPEEAEILAYRLIQVRYLRMDEHGLFRTLSSDFDSLGSDTVLLDTTQSPIATDCEVRIPLRQGALSSVKCTPAEGR